MKLHISKSKNSVIYYVAKSYRIRRTNKVKTKLIERIGSRNELIKNGINNPLEYARNIVKQRTEEEKENNTLNYSKEIDFRKELNDMNLEAETKSLARNIGWFYINKIFYQLGIKDFFNNIKDKRKYDATEICCYLTADRILNPRSKKGSFDNRYSYFNAPDYSLMDSYRLLDILEANSNELQRQLYSNLKNLIKLDNKILIYDCTNYYFEIDNEDDNICDDNGDIIQWGLRRYGKSKEHRPNPIVQMGLMVEGNGIPIAYTLTHGSANEQTTTIPIEERIIKDYDKSRFIYCSDGGLGSFDTRFFNTLERRNYIVTQSLKKTPEKELQSLFKDINWKFLDNDENASLRNVINIANKIIDNKPLTEEENLIVKKDLIYKQYPIKRKVPLEFFKKRFPCLTGNVEMSETVIITLSIKYYIYEKNIFNRQVESAKTWIKKDPDKIKNGPNDIRRLIKSISSTKEGEVATEKTNIIDEELIKKESKFHGFYAVATSLQKMSVKEIMEINTSRWKIEQSFRIIKTDFSGRPAFHSNPQRIKAHFAICFLALLIYRIIEHKINNDEFHFTTNQIVNSLREMKVINFNDVASQSIYTNSIFLQRMNKIFDLKLNYEFYKNSWLKKISQIK